MEGLAEFLLERGRCTEGGGGETEFFTIQRGSVWVIIRKRNSTKVGRAKNRLRRTCLSGCVGGYGGTHLSGGHEGYDYIFEERIKTTEIMILGVDFKFTNLRVLTEI